MAQHVTIIMANSSSVHLHGEVMYDSDEGILVVDLLETEGTAHFPIKEGYVVSWVTTEMSAEEEHLRREHAAEEQRKLREQMEGGDGLNLDH